MKPEVRGHGVMRLDRSLQSTNSDYYLNKLTIFFISPSLEVGGAERNLVHVANYLRARGEDVHIILLFGQGPLLDDLEKSIKVHNLGARRYAEALLLLLRRPHLRTKNCVYVSTVYMTGVLSCCVKALTFSSFKVIVGGQNSFIRKINNPDNFKDKLFLNIIARFCFRWADLVLGCSKGVADELQSFLGLEPRKMTVIYNSINSSVIERSGARGGYRRYSNKLNTPIRICSVGRLVEQKGFDILIRALKILDERKLTFLCTIVGDGPLRDQLINQVSLLGIADRVTFQGACKAPYAVMAQSDVFVLSSRWEGFGIVIVEALALGLPVVASDCEFGPGEILTSPELGVLVAPESPIDIAVGVERSLLLMGDANSQARRRRARDFDVSVIGRRYLSVIRQLKSRQYG